VNALISLACIAATMLFLRILSSDQLIEMMIDGILHHSWSFRFWSQFTATAISYFFLQLTIAFIMKESDDAPLPMWRSASSSFSMARPTYRQVTVAASQATSLLLSLAMTIGACLFCLRLWDRAPSRIDFAFLLSLTMALIGGVLPLPFILNISRYNEIFKRKQKMSFSCIALVYPVLFIVIYAFDSNPWLWTGITALLLYFLCFNLLLVWLLFRDHNAWIGLAFGLFVIIPAVYSMTQQTTSRGNYQRANPISQIERVAKLPTLSESISAWIANRNIGDPLISKKYPIFVVSAQGGGMYAAYHAAYVLARLDELSCGEFYEHLFSISAASGGALGSSVYAAIAKAHYSESANTQTNKCDNATISKVRKYFDVDIVSPMVASGLFVDLPLSMLGTNRWLFGKSARIRAFEHTVIGNFAANDEVEASEYFEQDFLEFWRPDRVGAALIFTSVMVNNGAPIVISPFRDLEPFPIIGAPANVSTTARWSSNYWAFVDRDAPRSLVAMVGATSRFPFISPADAVSWQHIDNKKAAFKIADGGFVDNSGVSSTNVIIDAIKEEAKKLNLQDKIEIVSLVIGDSPDNWVSPDAFDPGEIYSVFLSLYRSRFIQEQRALDELSKKGVTVVHNYLNRDFKNFVLSWQLSNSSRAEVGWIADFSGTKRHAGFDGPDFFQLDNYDGICRLARKLMTRDRCYTARELLREVSKNFRSKKVE
jgi:hypothetical protein